MRYDYIMNIKVSDEGIKKALIELQSDPRVQLNEVALEKLFRKTYPDNTKKSEIHIKVSALNTLYSTQLRGRSYPVTNHIYSLDIDDRLRSGDISVVDDIIRTPIGDNKLYRCYSFATKFCSFHNPEAFPIYDSYVDSIIKYLQKKDGFAGDKTLNNRDYQSFVRSIRSFQNFYKLGSYSIKDIDKYLWSLGYELKQQMNKENI